LELNCYLVAAANFAGCLMAWSQLHPMGHWRMMVPALGLAITLFVALDPIILLYRAYKEEKRTKA
jgi:hypothetical protein